MKKVEYTYQGAGKHLISELEAIIEKQGNLINSLTKDNNFDIHSIACSCGNKTFTHWRSNVIRCRVCYQTKTLDSDNNIRSRFVN